MTSPRSSKKSAAIVGVAVMASRLMGLVREQIFAFMFGATIFADAFVAAFRIPNLLRDLFAEGALSTAFTTTFTKTLDKEGAEPPRGISPGSSSRRSSSCSVSFVFSASSLAPWVVTVISGGFENVPGKFELTVRHDAAALSLHPLRLARRRRHGHAQRAKYFRHPGQRQHGFQHRLRHLRRGARLPLRAAKKLVSSPLRRAGHLSAGASACFSAGWPSLASSFRRSGGSVSLRWQAQFSRLGACADRPDPHGAKRHRRLRRAGQRRWSTASSPPTSPAPSRGSTTPSGSCNCPSAFSASPSPRSHCPPSRGSTRWTTSRPSARRWRRRFVSAFISPCPPRSDSPSSPQPIIQSDLSARQFHRTGHRANRARASGLHHRPGRLFGHQDSRSLLLRHAAAPLRKSRAGRGFLADLSHFILNVVLFTPARVSLIGIALNLVLCFVLFFCFHLGHVGLALTTGFVAMLNFLQLVYAIQKQIDLGRSPTGFPSFFASPWPPSPAPPSPGPGTNFCFLNFRRIRFWPRFYFCSTSPKPPEFISS